MDLEAIIAATGEIVPFGRDHLANGRVTRTGLDLPNDLALEDWANIGDALALAEQSVMWWIGDWWAYGERQGYGERSAVLEHLREAGHNPPSLKTCADAAWVARRFKASDRSEHLSWTHHRAVARLDNRDAIWFLERAQTNGWSVAQLLDEVRRHRLELLRRPGERKYKTQTIEDLERLVVEGRRFGTIYADPPWPYGNQATRAATRNHYKAHNDLTIEDICALPVGELTAASAHCHLWTTNGFLREAFDVMAAWGFTYKSCFVWIKPDFGIGNYWRVGHEFMLLGIKGKAPFGDNSQQSWIAKAAGEHSAKPPAVRGLIERVSRGPFLELFGRREIENWTVWGNEIERISDAPALNLGR